MRATAAVLRHTWWALAFVLFIIPGINPALAKTCPPHAVYGDIAAFYHKLGGSDGALGCPTSDEMPNGSGRSNTFDNGEIVWSPNSGGGKHLTIAAWSNNGSGPITVQWTGYGLNETLVRWNLNGANVGQGTYPNGAPGSYGVESGSISVAAAGVYEIITEECDKDFLQSADCGTWSPPIHVSITQGGGAGASACTPKLVVAADTRGTTFNFAYTCFPASTQLAMKESDEASPPNVYSFFFTTSPVGADSFGSGAACGPGMVHFQAMDKSGKQPIGNDAQAPCPVSTIGTKSFGGSSGTGGALAGYGSQQVTYSMPPGAQDHTDRPGGDIFSEKLPQTDPNLCKAACDARSDCAAWTYVLPGFVGPGAMCFLKNPAPATAASSCCISGKKLFVSTNVGNSAKLLGGGAASVGGGSATTGVGSLHDKLALQGLPGGSVTCVHYTGSREECTETADLAFTSNGGSRWTATFTAPAAHCSPIIYYVTAANGAIGTSPAFAGTHGYPGTAALAPGQTASVTFDASLPAGTQHLRVHAIGIAGGCNTGTLGGWGVQASVAPAAAAPLLHLKLPKATSNGLH